MPDFKIQSVFDLITNESYQMRQSAEAKVKTERQIKMKCC